MTTTSVRTPLTPTEIVDEYFIETRNRIIEVAAFLDRLDRADPARAAADFRVRALREALEVLLAGAEADRVRQIQLLMSDPTTEPLPALDRKGAVGAWDHSRGGGR